MKSIKFKRLIWRLRYKGNDLRKYLFVDETTIRLWDPPLYHWRLLKAYPESIPTTDKYRKKENIWGGISFFGSTKFAVSLLLFSNFFVRLIIKPFKF
jgi:hypothetical protein